MQNLRLKNETIKFSSILCFLNVDFTVGCKKTGKQNFPNVNLVLSICQLIVHLTIPIK
jgi:hypothetical protein